MTLGARAGQAEQFVLFQQEFELTKATVDKAGSHYFVRGTALSQPPASNWTGPVDYRNGTVHIRTEVLEKPAGGEPNHWSYCYMPNRPIGPGYGCAGSGVYKEKGVYDRIEKMTSWWQNTAISWPQGIKEMHLVVKGMGDSGHLHKRSDVDKLFPSKVRITMVQVSAGGTFDPSKVPGMNSSPVDAGTPGGGPAADAGVPVDPGPSTGSGGTSGQAGASGSGGTPGGGEPAPTAGTSGGSGGSTGAGSGGSGATTPAPMGTGTAGASGAPSKSGGDSGGSAPAGSDGTGPVSGSGALGCSIGTGANPGPLSLGALALVLVRLALRRRKPQTA